MKKTDTLDFSITLPEEHQKNIRAEQVFITDGFGIVYNTAHLVKNLLTNRQITFAGKLTFTLKQPYRLKEARIIMMLQGKAVVRHNLIEYILHPNDIFVIPSGSIIQVMELFPGTELRMIGMGSNFIQSLRKEENLEHYLGYRQNLLLSLSGNEMDEIESYFSLIWNIVQHEEFRRDVVQSIVTALIQSLQHIRKGNENSTSDQSTRQEELFNRFLALVNQHSDSQRNVNFYADKLCLTPRYLNTVIRQTSQKTVMEWINHSIILEAKVLLKHNDLLIYQVSDKLNFPNPSFFCKFFKRITGMSPQEYQRE